MMNVFFIILGVFLIFLGTVEILYRKTLIKLPTDRYLFQKKKRISREKAYGRKNDLINGWILGITTFLSGVFLILIGIFKDWSA